MKCIVGLGNPGREYERTPHNAGFDVVDRLAGSWSVAFKRSFRFPARLAEHRMDGERILLVKPMTFMNRSGQAVGPIARKHGVEVRDVLVVVDDADLPLGKIRIRAQGSAGGHNGLKSVMAALGSDAYPRIRIGIGRGGGDLKPYVLNRLPPEDQQVLDDALDRAAAAAEHWIGNPVALTMNVYNG